MTRAVKGSAKHPALRVHPWAPGLFAEILKARFSWLGTDKSIDYMDECCTLADLYKELQEATVPEVEFKDCKNPDCPVGCPDSHSLDLAADSAESLGQTILVASKWRYKNKRVSNITADSNNRQFGTAMMKGKNIDVVRVAKDTWVPKVNA